MHPPDLQSEIQLQFCWIFHCCVSLWEGIPVDLMFTQSQRPNKGLYILYKTYNTCFFPGVYLEVEASKYYRLERSLTPIFRSLACSGPSIPAATRCPEMDRFGQNQDVSFSTGPPPSVQCDLPGTDGSRSNTNCSLHKPTSKIVIKEIHLYIYDGSSKVLFPLLALNRNAMRDAFCLTCKKKVILKIQVTCSKSISLEKKWFVSCKKS